MTTILAPYTSIADIDGSPLDAGFVYIGEQGKNPEASPVPVFWDADFTIPAAQPIRTRNGYPVRNGSPAKIYLREPIHSISVKNRNGSTIFVDVNGVGLVSTLLVRPSGVTVEQTFKDIDQEINTKADQNFVEDQLELKANAIDVHLKSETYTQVEVNNLVDPKADQTYVDEAIGAISTDANKQYATLAAANADIANIVVGRNVFISEAANGGYWYKETAGSTSLTKSPHDPLAQAKKYADETKAPLENFNNEGNPDHLHELRDSLNRIVAAWNLKAEYVGKLLTDGIIRSVEQPDGSFALILGDGKQVDIYGSTFTADFSNPDVAFEIRDANNKVVFSVPISGIEDTETDDKEDASSDIAVYQIEKLSETVRKLAAINAGETEQLIITAIGNSWVDDTKNFMQNSTQALKAKYGNAGAGFGAIERGFADPTEATITRSSGWTTVNGATSNNNIPSPAIISSSQSTADAYVEVSLLKGTATKAYLYALSNGAEVNVLKNGSLIKTITVSSTITDLGIELAETDKLRIVVVSGTFTIYGVELRNNSKGVRINKCGAGSSRWDRWLYVDAATWQSQIAHLGADLTILLEGVNGSFVYDANAEANYTEQMISRVRAATKNTDILLISPPEVLSAKPYSLFDYAHTLRNRAKTWKLCHLDLQLFFGESTSEYNDTGKGYILNSDQNHPSDKGSRLISGAIQRIINQ